MRKDKLLEIMDEVGIEYVSETPNSGGWIPALCPFAEFLHDSGKDTNPSFFMKVNNEGVSAGHCFTCKTKGSVSSIIRQLAHHREEDYSELIIESDLEDIPQGFGDFEMEEELSAERKPLIEDAYLSMFPLAYEHDEAIRYLKVERVERSGGIPIGKKAAEIMGLRFDPRQHRILFPVRGRDNTLYGYSGRSVLPSRYITDRHPKIRDYEFDKSLSLLGENLIQEGKPLLVVEGLFAFATMIELGVREFCNPVATLGSVMSLAQRDLIIDADENVVLLYDLDAAGDRGIYGDKEKNITGALEMLEKHLPVHVPEYPEDCEDPDLLTKEEVRAMVEDC